MKKYVLSAWALTLKQLVFSSADTNFASIVFLNGLKHQQSVLAAGRVFKKLKK